jgi:peptidoglycan/xylan/chitin deacetylase (PgdA/CDA1 family)
MAWWMADIEHEDGPRCDVSDRVLLTTSWDDGNPLDVRIADTLEQFGLVGTFYASTGPDGRRLINDQDLASGTKHELGAHSQNHTIFPELPRSALADGIHWADEEMSRFGGVGSLVAPPRGKTNASASRFIGQLGFAVGTGAIVGSGGVTRNSLEPTFQLYPREWKTTARNCVYRRRLPMSSLLVPGARKASPEDRFHQMLLAAPERQRYVHVWGHAADIHRLNLWGALRDLLAIATELGLTPVSNTEAFDRLSRNGRPRT